MLSIIFFQIFSFNIILFVLFWQKLYLLLTPRFNDNNNKRKEKNIVQENILTISDANLVKKKNPGKTAL